MPLVFQASRNTPYKETFPRISLFQKFRKIITNAVFWKFLLTQKKVPMLAFLPL